MTALSNHEHMTLTAQARSATVDALIDMMNEHCIAASAANAAFWAADNPGTRDRAMFEMDEATERTVIVRREMRRRREKGMV